VFGARWLLPFVVGLSVFLWPGFMARGVTISNSALALPVALLFLHELWRADAERDVGRRLTWAGLLLGLCLLTKLTLVFLVAPFLFVVARLLYRRRDRHALGRVALALVLPVLMLAPWVAFNLNHYSSLTGNDVGRDLEQEGLPTKPDFHVGDVPAKTGSLLDSFLPEEWKHVECGGGGGQGEFALGGGTGCQFADYRTTAMSANAIVLKLLIYGLPLLALLLVPRLVASRAFGLLFVPLVLAVVTIQLTLLLANWDIFFPRHAYPVLPAFALFAVIAWRRLLAREWAVAAVAGAVLLCAVAFWVDRGLGVGHL
jgi:hypothetical protein